MGLKGKGGIDRLSVFSEPGARENWSLDQSTLDLEFWGLGSDHRNNKKEQYIINSSFLPEISHFTCNFGGDYSSVSGLHLF